MESTKINVNEITIKASSKKEVYRLLQLEGDVYMPHYRSIKPPICFRDFIRNQKGKSGKMVMTYHVKSCNLKVLQVPQVDGLKLKDIVAFATKLIPNFKDYLPNYKNADKLPDRSFVWNVGILTCVTVK